MRLKRLVVKPGALLAAAILALGFYAGVKLYDAIAPIKARTAGSGVIAHQGYETLSDYCPLCHSIEATLDRWPMTARDLSDKYCRTCHVPKVPRPDPMTVFTGRPRLSFRLVLNNIGSAVSVYQENPDIPFLSGHRKVVCLGCHTAHKRGQAQIETAPGNTYATKLLKIEPSLKASGLKGGRQTPSDWPVDGSRWCLSCHPQISAAVAHNHPDYLCPQCHQDPEKDNPLGTAQSPHASERPNLLVADPDVLCLDCHIKGSVP